MASDDDPHASGTACPTCGWRDRRGRRHLSSHLTSQGVVSYWRCVCGAVLVVDGGRVLGSAG
jgi:hypothetical protein